MYKVLSTAVLLLAVFAFTSGSKSVGAVPTTPTMPVIVAQGSFINQTTGFNEKEIYTPSATGLYRLTVYAIITTPDTNSTSNWEWSPDWFDAAGFESPGTVLFANNNRAGLFMFGYPNYFGVIQVGGYTMTFQAKAGTRIFHAVTLNGPADNSAYTLYYVLESL